MRPLRGTQPNTTSPDMTPMMDIVFIMLIFFIITASFIKEKGVVINHPHGNLPVNPPSDPKTIAFQINANNQILYEGLIVDIWRAEAIIKQRHTADPDFPVVVSLSEGAKHGKMIRLHDAAIAAGIPRGYVAVVTI